MTNKFKGLRKKLAIISSLAFAGINPSTENKGEVENLYPNRKEKKEARYEIIRDDNNDNSDREFKVDNYILYFPSPIQRFIEDKVSNGLRFHGSKYTCPIIDEKTLQLHLGDMYFRTEKIFEKLMGLRDNLNPLD